MRLLDSLASALPIVLLVGCASTTVEKEPETPETVEAEGTSVPAPPPGGETQIETEDAEGNEREVEIKTDED
jgi:hypothetical protein